MITLLRELYGYHAWANGELFEKLAALDPQGSELHTALRLISHYHVVAEIFSAHLTGRRHGHVADNVAETPTLEALRGAVAATDQWYLDYAGNVSADELAALVPFTFTDGDQGCMSRQEMLIHVALHGGYHRGEVGRILWGLSITPPWDTFAVYLHQSEPARRLQQVAAR